MILSIQAVGSYLRKNAPTPQIVAEYHIYLAAKIVDPNGEPVSGLTADNFVVRASGIDEAILPNFNVNESPNAAEFPGCYHLTTLYNAPASFLSMDFFLMTGLIVVLKVTREEASGIALVQLTPCIANTVP